jgi:hypothetical protein
MASTSGVLTICLDALDVLEGDHFPPERKADALRLLRARLPELGPKDAEKYYKVVEARRHRPTRGGEDVLPDPGLNWSF